MKKIFSSIILIFSIVLLSIFVTILVSENSNIVSYLYKDRIVKEIENKISLNVNFNDFRVKWEGLNPQLIFNDLSLYSKKDNCVILKSDSFIVDFELNYENKIIGNQRNFVNFSKDSLDEVINSRTFCLFEDIEHIKKLGLAKGGSLANAVVVDDEKVLNKEGLRNQKEFVNHKILDLVGDFILSGFSFLGKVKCTKGGHQLSNLFLSVVVDSLKVVEINNHKKIDIDNLYIKFLKSSGFRNKK